MKFLRLFWLLLAGFAPQHPAPGLPVGMFRVFAYSHASYASYDGLGRKVRQTDEAGVSTGFTYDFRGLLTAVTLDWGQTDAQTTTYGYDEFGNEVSQTTPNSPNSQTTTYQYDALGRRSQRSLPGGQAETFGCDAVGNAVLHTTFNGVVLTNQYDALNRLTQTIQSGGGYQVSQTYTAAGMRQTLTDSTGANTWIYNGLNRLITNTSPRGTLYYAYDVAGSVTNIWSGTVGGVNLQYCYDCLGRLTNTLANGTSVAVHGYDGVGNLAGTTLGNGVTNYYQYTAENRLVSLNWKHGSSARASFAYSLDLAGTRTNLSETVNGTAQSYGWSYDRFYRLTNEVIGSGTPAGTVAYALDTVGNRTNRTSSVAGVTNVTNTFTTNDWLTTAAYDANGNTLTNGSIVSQYDALGRLTNCHTGSATVVLAYNGDGTRVSKTIGTTTTLYLVDDRNPSGYPQVLEESTVSGGSTTLSRIYMWGTSLINQKQASGGAVHYYGLDGHGSVRFLMDTSGNVTDTYTYDAFGLEVATTGGTANNYLYSGEQYDPDLGMYYLRARYYKPDMGRFWTMDTYEGDQEEPMSLHKYLYCQVDPVNNDDPLGLFQTTDFGMRVQEVIQDDFVKAGDPEFRGGNRAIGTLVGQKSLGSLALRPDLYDKTPGNSFFYEIKPATAAGIAEGTSQIALYNMVLNHYGPWRPGEVRDYKYSPLGNSVIKIDRYGNPLPGGGVAIVFPPVGGLITYIKLDSTTPRNIIQLIADTASYSGLAGMASIVGLNQYASSLTALGRTSVAMTSVEAAAADQMGIGMEAASLNTAMGEP